VGGHQMVACAAVRLIFKKTADRVNQVFEARVEPSQTWPGQA
jgi:hypothetical protein